MTKKLRITILLPHVSLSGGVKAAMEYANRLQRLGHDVTLAFPAPRKRGLRKFLPSFQPERPQTMTADAVAWFPIECRILQIPALASTWLPEADIHVATSWQTADAVAEVAGKSGRGFYLVQHHEVLWAREKEKEQAARTYSLPLRKIVISSWLKEIMKNEYGADSLLVVTPVNSGHFYPNQGTKPDPLRICTLHHNYDWKGFPDILEAFRIVQREIPEINPVIFGAKIKTKEEFMQEYDFPCEYHYSPPIEKLREIYTSCGMFVCSSWIEGLGMPAMEAMACGSALVTTDTGGSWDYALHNETALVSPPKEPQALAENILKMLKDEEMRQKLAQNGKKQIQGFTWDDNVSKMVDYFTAS